ncbi:LGFP repeat-containing protein [Lentzea kentuckyensis]|uniref:LGFP repeat-containing protein n=1 Tax=Lentzea kentuckyensis TaxID=360086 RepID=UPI00117A4E47|nr:hypothetical protein [Lentzea kentuckyensis]
MSVRSSLVVVAALLAAAALPFGTAHAADEWEKSPVYAKWQALGGAAFAGDKVGDEVVERDGKRWAKFSKYDIVITWRESAGAHWFSGAISRRWFFGSGSGPVAVTDQVQVNRGAQAGASVDFEYGSSVFYSDAYGAFWVHGTERYTYLGNGGPTGKFGWPTSDLLPVGERLGWEQRFSEAVSTYREPERSAVWISGALRDRFREELAAGRRNWPAGDQLQRAGNGWSIRMNRGAIYWSTQTGARLLDYEASNALESNGGPGGQFGYPATDTTAHDGGFTTDFVNKTTVYLGPADDGAFWISGRVRDEYGMQGGLAGPLGWPRSSQTPAPGTDGVYVLFGDARDKVILWGPRTGGHLVRGQILEELRGGGDVAVYGLPQTGEWIQPTFTFQQFEFASIFPMGTATHTLGWDFRDIWWQTGGTESPLGLVASDALEVQPKVFHQQFTNGWITCDYNGGQCVYSVTGSKAQPQTQFHTTTSGPRR